MQESATRPPRAKLPRADIARQLAHLRVLRRVGLFCVDEDLCTAVLDEAVRFASAVLEPMNAAGKRDEPSVVDGRVHLAPVQIDAWRRFALNGWPGIDLPEAVGGQGLPATLTIASQEIFDRSSAAFSMMVVPVRSAARLIAAYGDPDCQAEWLSHLADGSWGATICISETGAGSDVARLKTRAGKDEEGVWRITGEKQWISFGDHDAVERIAHCLLARTEAGISLFLVPDLWDGARNGVQVRRIEEKLGLHLSPTCALGFEDARAVLLGADGSGLAQMFVMITNMRLAVGAMGLGLASASSDIAWSYAGERKQGGREAEPLAIKRHFDVQRQLVVMAAKVEMLRGLVYRAAAYSDRSREGGADAARATRLLEWLLPIVKTLGGQFAFDVSSDALQVLGGAGYTRDWPVEQYLRDARVLTIFEGTSGIQALDLVQRCLPKDGGAALEAFVETAIEAASGCWGDQREAAHEVFALLSRHGNDLLLAGRPEREKAASAFLHLASEAALTMVATELSTESADDHGGRRLRGVALAWLAGTRGRAAAAAAAIEADATAIAQFELIDG